MTEQETDPEIYQELVRLIKERNQQVTNLEQEVKNLKEMITKNAEKKKVAEEKILGYCAKCQLPLLADDIVNPACPRCGHQAYRSNQAL